MCLLQQESSNQLESLRHTGPRNNQQFSSLVHFAVNAESTIRTNYDRLTKVDKIYIIDCFWFVISQAVVQICLATT